MTGSSLLHVLALICPFIMKNVNDQMALAIAKTWPLRWCLCGRRVSISSGYIRLDILNPHRVETSPLSAQKCQVVPLASPSRRTFFPPPSFPSSSKHRTITWPSAPLQSPHPPHRPLCSMCQCNSAVISARILPHCPPRLSSLVNNS